jgi:hypothetical protein
MHVFASNSPLKAHAACNGRGMRKDAGLVQCHNDLRHFYWIGVAGIATTFAENKERIEAAAQHSQHGCRGHERPGHYVDRCTYYHSPHPMGRTAQMGVAKVGAIAALARGAGRADPARLHALPLARRIP